MTKKTLFFVLIFFLIKATILFIDNDFVLSFLVLHHFFYWPIFLGVGNLMVAVVCFFVFFSRKQPKLTWDWAKGKQTKLANNSNHEKGKKS